MKKQFLNLGKALNKVEQKLISGGRAPICEPPTIACYNSTTHLWSCEIYC